MINNLYWSEFVKSISILIEIISIFDPKEWINMDKEPEKMRDGNEFQQVLKKFEEMILRNVSSFFDIDEFEEIIDYYLDTRNYKHAYEAGAIASRQHPNSNEITIKLVHVHLESGKPVQALETLNQIEALESVLAEINLLKGNALAQLGKYTEAEKYFDIAIEKTEEELVETLINISISFENSKHYRIAVKYLYMAYEIEKENVTVLYDLGYYYERMHNYKLSLEFYNKYLDVDSFSENAWYNIGVVYSKINKKKEAIDAYDYAIAINPVYASAYFNKANIFATDKDYTAAIKVYNDFLEIEPDNLQGWTYLGECYEETGDYIKALSIYHKIIEIDNTYADGWFGVGISNMYLEKYTDAAQYVLKAIEFDRENSEYWFTLGEIYEKTEVFPEAVKCYRHVTILEKEDREAWLRLTNLLIKGANYDEALVYLRDAYQHNFTSQDIVYTLSAVYFKMKDDVAGMQFLEKASNLGEGGLHLFFKIYPEGKKNKKIMSILKKSTNDEY